eukprot:symbB.v1.2.023142.t1/scaffold2098.1/size89601/3
MPSNSWNQAHASWCKSCRSFVEDDPSFRNGYCGDCWKTWKGAANYSARGWKLDKIAISDILFSQATISDSFGDGTPVEEMIRQLSTDPFAIEQIPYISIVDDCGKHVSMDNRRLYAFRMAFEDTYAVPVKRYACKEDYGASEFERKATSICGGHLIEIRHRNEMDAPHAEYLDLPRNAKSFLLQKWSEVRDSIGARLRIHQGQVVISGSQRQVEDGIKQYQRILSTHHHDKVDLKDVRAKDAVRSGFQQWKTTYPTVELSYEDEWTERGELWLYLGGEADEVADAKAWATDVVNNIARFWESIKLPAHSGGYFGYFSKSLYGKLPGKCNVEEDVDILHIFGNAAERDKVKRAFETLKKEVTSKQLQVDDGRLRSLIIGKAGANIKQLRQNTSVHVHVGKDPDTSVRVTGPMAEVETVVRRLKALIQEQRQVVCTVRLLAHSARCIRQRLKSIGCESEAYLSMPYDGEEDVLKIHGNQRQVDYAEDLLQKSLFANFSSSKLKLSKHLKSVSSRC